jgi:hypothetical protein
MEVRGLTGQLAEEAFYGLLGTSFGALFLIGEGSHFERTGADKGRFCKLSNPSLQCRLSKRWSKESSG